MSRRVLATWNGGFHLPPQLSLAAACWKAVVIDLQILELTGMTRKQRRRAKSFGAEPAVRSRHRRPSSQEDGR